jgi:hypothetical protein
MRMLNRSCLLVALTACDLLSPRVSDVTIDAPTGAPDASGPSLLLPEGATVPSIADNAELVSQIKIFDGLDDGQLEENANVVMLEPAKAAGAAVKFWSFGTVPVVDGIISASLVYVLADDFGGVLVPRTDHPLLIDSVPGDVRYSAIRRVVFVPVSSTYAGERITSVDALREAIDRGLVGEPTPAGVWRNMPVVPPSTRLDVGATTAPLAATEVFGRGYRVGVFLLGIPQPFRFGGIPMGQESRLLSGVPAGSPPLLTSVPDDEPVFQYGIPAAAPTASFNYTPVVTELDVRLADGTAPSDVTSDVQLFKRANNGAITGQWTDTVSSYVITTLCSNKQIQFVEGQP